MLSPTSNHHCIHCCLQPFFSWMQDVVFDFFLTRALLLSPAPGFPLPPTSCSSLRNLGVVQREMCSMELPVPELMFSDSVTVGVLPRTGAAPGARVRRGGEV